MSFTTIFIIAGAVLLVILFVIAKLAIRWMSKVVFIGVVLAAVLGAFGFWWWSNRLTTKPKPVRIPPAGNRRGSTP